MKIKKTVSMFLQQHGPQVCSSISFKCKNYQNCFFLFPMNSILKCLMYEIPSSKKLLPERLNRTSYFPNDTQRDGPQKWFKKYLTKYPDGYQLSPYKRAACKCNYISRLPVISTLCCKPDVYCLFVTGLRL